MRKIKLEWKEGVGDDSVTTFYDHVIAKTPLGLAVIEWKSWKRYDFYDLRIGDEYLDHYISLDEAKNACESYLMSKADELNALISEVGEKP